MKSYTYSFEVKDLLVQFLSAFDDITIKRYNKDRQPQEEIQVRYVLAPKQRVMYDIVNKAQNLTLPVVAVNVTSIERDNTRNFNKINNLYTATSDTTSTVVRMPVPINISVSMSILARYMEDMDQILSNFIPFNNPYIILSWKEPTTVANEVIEIRSEVLWSGNIALTSPTDTTYNDKFRIVADTNFTIKGWLFKNKNEIAAPIYFIDANFYQLSGSSLNITSDSDLDALQTNEVETISLSAYPTITNLWHNYQTNLTPVREKLTISGEQSSSNNFLIYGSNFNYTTGILLSSNNPDLYDLQIIVDTIKMGSVTGYPLTTYSILNDNIISLTLPYTPNTGDLDILVINPVGYASTARMSTEPTLAMSSETGDFQMQGESSDTPLTTDIIYTPSIEIE